MIDIGSVLKGLHPGAARDKVEGIQAKGQKLAIRVLGTFTLVGHRAVTLKAEDGTHFHALIHNEADDKTDYLVIHIAGDSTHRFHGTNVEEDVWVTNFIDFEYYDQLMRTTASMLLEHANLSYKKFYVRNFGTEPEPLTENDIDLDSFALDLSHKDLSLSHEGNMRLAF
jgi:hypothetical protein